MQRMGSGGGSGIGSGRRRWQGYKDSALWTTAALAANSMIRRRVFCLFVLWNQRPHDEMFPSCPMSQPPHAPSWSLSVLVSGVTTRGYFIHLQTLIYFLPFYTQKSIACTPFFTVWYFSFFTYISFGNYSIPLPHIFGWLHSPPICGLMWLLNQPLADGHSGCLHSCYYKQG